MDARERIREASGRIADAIGRRDVAALGRLLAAGFAHRTPGAPPADREAFLRGIEQSLGEILSVRLEDVDIDVCGDGALVTGIQHAQVRIDGHVIDDRRGFLDWFVLESGEWRIRAAADVPLPEPPA
jgi:ketosteroid isomerase-like protein